MAYSKNNNWRPPYQYQPQQPRSAGYYPQQPQFYPQPLPPKKSGAKYSKIKEGNFKGFTIVNAWNKSKRRGLITCTVAPYHASKDAKGNQLMYVGEKNGNTYMKMIASVKYEDTGNTQLIPCSMNMETQVISLKELSMVITPNGSGTTASGKRVTGYFGTFLKK